MAWLTCGECVRRPILEHLYCAALCAATLPAGAADCCKKAPLNVARPTCRRWGNAAMTQPPLSLRLSFAHVGFRIGALRGARRRRKGRARRRPGSDRRQADATRAAPRRASARAQVVLAGVAVRFACA